MSATLRFAAFGVAVLILGGAVYAFSQMRPDPDREVFLGVDGDPRMRLCDTPADAELATPQIVQALNVASPLVRGEGQGGAYRISVLRPPGQESLSLSFSTGSRGSDEVVVRTTTGGPATEVRVPLDYARAADLVYALEGAGIWGEMRPTVETLVRAGEASAVVEVRAPRHDRCITTRYDDERVRPMLAVFARELAEVNPDLSIDGLVAPERSFLPSAAKAGAGR